MTTRESEAVDLLRLAAEVEAQQEPSRVMDALVARALTGRRLVSPADRATDENIEYWANVDQLPHFTAKFDDGLALLAGQFPELRVQMVLTMAGGSLNGTELMIWSPNLRVPRVTGMAKTPPLALLAALLRAKATA